MPQFFVPKKNLKHRPFYFDESESYHLSSVLRKRAGDVVQVFDGEGSVHAVRILDVSDPKRVAAELLKDVSIDLPRPQTSSHSASVTVSPALLKGPRFDWLLEKATEMGVTRICPVITERTIIDFKESQSASKMKRWNQILLASAKQCQRTTLPELHAPILFAESLRRRDPRSDGIILWEREENVFLSKFCAEKKSGSGNMKIHLFTGPEGGLTLQEIELAKLSGLQTVRLGENILRAETATISALSLLLF